MPTAPLAIQTETTRGSRTIQVHIKRQAGPDGKPVTEKFAIPYRPNMNITSVLGEIACYPSPKTPPSAHYLKIA